MDAPRGRIVIAIFINILKHHTDKLAAIRDRKQHSAIVISSFDANGQTSQYISHPFIARALEQGIENEKRGQ